MKILKLSILVIAIFCFTSCEKSRKSGKSNIIEQTSIYFEKNNNVAIYFTQSKNLDSIRTALIKEMDRLTKEKNINFFEKENNSKLICFNNKNLMPDVTNNPNDKLKGRYAKSIVCVLNGTSWGNHQFLYGGVKKTYKGNMSGFNKVVFKDKKTGKWEDWK